MKIRCLSALLFLFAANCLLAQQAGKKITSKQFFSDDRPLNITLKADLGTLLTNKARETSLKGTLICKFPDSLHVTHEIQVTTRGKFRLKNCDIPPMKFDFKKNDSTEMTSLKSLKITNGCYAESYNDQLLLKEFLTYKIYNILCEKSLRVRLVNMRFEDSRGRKKPIEIYSFFTEDMDEMAKRNECKELNETVKVTAGNTDREHFTLVCIFEYMIGNTDWSLPGGHNIKNIRLKNDSLSRPFAVPYDFDHAGLVNANYALPNEQFGTTSVLERVYRGYPRTMEELNLVIEHFKSKKEDIYTIIKNFEPLTARNKEQMIKYLDGFYSSINSEKKIKQQFIDNARKD